MNDMPEKYGRGDSYHTEKRGRSRFPTARFLGGVIAGPLLWLWSLAIRGRCDDIAWVRGSNWLASMYENTGGCIHVEGLANLDLLEGRPCVFIANHMSALETFLLPGMIRPRMPVTYVVKKSLMTIPVFGPVMRSRDPVAVGRVNPREDLAVVLEQGCARLASGVSMIVFPQSTRSLRFVPEHFNTIGIKLALRAGVPVLPIALKTDAWAQGKRIRELAHICPERPVRFRFGKPMRAGGRGRAEHAAICEFIGGTLAEWRKQDARASAG